MIKKSIYIKPKVYVHPVEISKMVMTSSDDPTEISVTNEEGNPDQPVLSKDMNLIFKW